jgi:hypothetical protein
MKQTGGARLRGEGKMVPGHVPRQHGRQREAWNVHSDVAIHAPM